MKANSNPYTHEQSRTLSWKRGGLIAFALFLLLLLVGWLFLALQTVPAIQAAPNGSIVVDSTADDLAVNGNCTLREAISAANTNTAVDNCPAGSPGEDTIILSPQTYTLSRAGIDENTNQTGDLDILESLVIAGEGATIDGANIDRVFHVDPALIGVNLTMEQITVINGSVTGDGGGILVEQGRVALLESTLSNNFASSDGGGVHVKTGYLHLINTIVESNDAGDGGGLYTDLGCSRRCGQPNTTQRGEQ